MTRSLSALLSLLLCLSTLGCAGETLSDHEWPGPDRPSSGSRDRAPSVADGRVTLAGVSFDAPTTWTAVPTSDIVAGATDNSARRVVESLGLTPEQLVDLARRADLVLVDLDTATRPIADTISVVRGPGPLVSPAGLEHDLATIQAELVGRAVAETRAGTVRRIAYTQRSPVGPDMAGEMLALSRDGQLVIATVLTGRRARTARLAEQIVGSLAPAG